MSRTRRLERARNDKETPGPVRFFLLTSSLLVHQNSPPKCLQSSVLNSVSSSTSTKNNVIVTHSNRQEHPFINPSAKSTCGRQHDDLALRYDYASREQKVCYPLALLRQIHQLIPYVQTYLPEYYLVCPINPLPHTLSLHPSVRSFYPHPCLLGLYHGSSQKGRHTH